MLSSSLINCKYRSDARPQTFNARDNVSQFIKWSRRVAGVREVLMFESDDLILRKNEKNFLLCLLEIARFGAKFGVSVPAIIKLEDEIEREIARDKQIEILSFTELKRLQREKEDEEENLKTKSESIHYQSILSDDSQTNYQSTHNDDSETNYQSAHNDDNQINKNTSDTLSLSNSNGATWLKERLTLITNYSDNNSKRRQSSDSTTSNEVTTTIMTSNEVSQSTQTLDEGEHPIQPPACSSHLHKTVRKYIR
jgi:hypothetical protein